MKSGNSDTLRKAVLAEDFSLVERAIKGGANVNSTDRDHRTPLFHAAIDGLHKIASKPLQEGADVNARDANEETPLHFAARRPETIIVNF